MSLSVFPQANGNAGVAQTLDHMARLINAAILDPVIRDQAAYAMSGCNRGAKDCQCYSMLSWVTRAVRYVPDPTGIELLHDPRLMARRIAAKKMVYGDCDDMSMYLAALLKSIGLAPTIRAVGYNGLPFQHVYVMCEGLRLDATRSPWMVTYKNMTESSAMERKV